MNAQLLFAFLSVTPSSSSSLKTMKSRQGHPRILLSLYNTLFLLHKLSQFSISFLLCFSRGPSPCFFLSICLRFQVNAFLYPNFLSLSLPQSSTNFIRSSFNIPLMVLFDVDICGVGLLHANGQL